MAKGLLLGNGINAYLGIKELSVKDIGERFGKNVAVYSSIIQNLFEVQIEEQFFKDLEKTVKELGIESLAGILYRYIKENKKSMWTDNDEYRVQDIIACICISAIFFAEEGKIDSQFDKTKLFSMAEYDYIYTLNYIEFWDDEKRCIHLHGKVDLPRLDNKKRAILISTGRKHLDSYARAVEQIKKANNVIEFNPTDIIFAPENIEKNKLICVSGLFPSDKLYPADDLFLYRSKELYKELEEIDELDIFGMSPYGDESLLEIINKKKKVRVYVYKKNENKEASVWQKKLTCEYEVLDSVEILQEFE
ncbi:MAG: hypothetical protein J6C22_14445 [Bacteroides sp.]|nr:hypothetical protein [Bacteroides sp.]